MKEIPTPLTDRRSFTVLHQHDEVQCVRLDVARQLERERAELREALQRLLRANESDYEQCPQMDVKTAYETNSQALQQARSVLERMK